MISELDKDILVDNCPCNVKKYLFNKINALEVGDEFYLKDLLSPYEPQGSLYQLGKEFAGLIQSGQWEGISIISENPNKYRKDAVLRKEVLFHQVHLL